MDCATNRKLKKMFFLRNLSFIEVMSAEAVKFTTQVVVLSMRSAVISLRRLATNMLIKEAISNDILGKKDLEDHLMFLHGIGILSKYEIKKGGSEFK
jgi:hypothetical protein